ncbi:MAG TPA: hypothetical protein PKA41_15135, partial [Verrucomicrobiota bacterium]|nr:hypothetical protein [Verrucomicrobiota bacterium]
GRKQFIPSFAGQPHKLTHRCSNLFLFQPRGNFIAEFSRFFDGPFAVSALYSTVRLQSEPQPDRGIKFREIKFSQLAKLPSDQRARYGSHCALGK